MAYDLIIIGGGPAGVSAGIYAARQKLNTLLITKDFSGQVGRKAVTIENYPGFPEGISGQELIKSFENHLRKQEISVELSEAHEVVRKGKNFLVFTTALKCLESKSLIVASGVNQKTLSVEGEKEFIGKGVSYCTVCDAPLFPNKNVAVIGGGNAGFEAAIALTRWAKKIYILEYAEKLLADKSNQEEALSSGKVEVLTGAALKKIQGQKFVNSIVYQDRKTKKEISLAVEGVFVEIGSQPAIYFLDRLVEFNAGNEIKIDSRTCETKTPGLFAAGDVTDVKDKQIVIAAGQGATAALSCYQYLRKIEKR